AVSGTATLELALWGVPTVLVYRASPLTALMARRLLQVRHVGLANILMDDQGIMPELLQETCTVENILRALDGLLDASTGQAEVQLRAFDCLRKKLGQADPAIAVVDMVRELARA
ncbi:MAG: lipid-A-disaccharide synthase, partial [Zetaproteobacteria bacterium]